jgi:hypothetical protein
MSYVCKQTNLYRFVTEFMNLSQNIEALHYLGSHIAGLSDDELDEWCARARNENPWFIPAFSKMALKGISEWLNREKLNEWTAMYGTFDGAEKTVGLVLAGNLPLVGFHDLLAVLLSRNKAMVKLSSQDSVLMKLVIDALFEIEPLFRQRISLVERLAKMDAVIATGSDNSSRYFDYYFSKYPHIIRKNRTSVAILNGHESKEDLERLHDDVFLYFGLGCRNVSKIFVPQAYDWIPFIESGQKYIEQITHHKYVNNYDYNKSVYLVNRIPHLDSGFFMLKEDEGLVSPLSVIFYESYESPNALQQKLAEQKDKIQCIVSQSGLVKNEVPFGQAQFPGLADYADGIDTMVFLSEIKQQKA